MAGNTVKVKVELDQEQQAALADLSKAADRVRTSMARPAETANLENPRFAHLSRTLELAPRRAAFDAINSERDYQDSLWGGGHDREHSPAEWILFMEEYIANARHIAATDPHGEILAMHAIRKVAALAVAAMEVNGSPKR
jgi:hypothetical protein